MQKWRFWAKVERRKLFGGAAPYAKVVQVKEDFDLRL